MSYLIIRTYNSGRNGFFPVALLCSLALSGCQLLPTEPDESPTLASPAKVETVASHDFSITEQQNIVGDLASVSSLNSDTLSDIARHYGLGYNDIAHANPELDPWALNNDQQVLLPLQFILPEAPRKGIVLNLANMRMFYFPKNQADNVKTYPVGIGRDGWSTPLGSTQIVAKKANPDWTVPESIQREHQELGDPLPKVVHSGPDNPLGAYAMPLGIGNYLIHGTNKPYGIGMQVSHGCIQMYPEDIQVLFQKVEVGTPVRIVHQPYLAAWRDDNLYLEAHQPLEKWAKQDGQLVKDLQKRLQKMALQHNAAVDWVLVDTALQRKDGVPVPVLQHSSGLTGLRTSALQLRHPDQLYGQPQVAELADSDWSLMAASFAQENDAKKFAAMLNHQGPPIPARKVAKDGQFQVIAGPFKNKKEAKQVAKRIKSNFDMEAVAIEPRSTSNQAALLTTSTSH
jgi:L,D-transpeptidase ErfK/SrfK